MRLLIELLKPATTDLARRWVAALLNVPEEDRAAVVASVEAEIMREYHGASSEAGPSPESEPESGSGRAS